MNALLNLGVVGVLVSIAQISKNPYRKMRFEEARRSKIPLVMFDGICEDFPCDKITVGNFDSAYKATDYLLRTGCKKIAFVSTIPHTNVGEMRKEGYRQAVLYNSTFIYKPILVSEDNANNLKIRLRDILRSQNIDSILAADEYATIISTAFIHGGGFKIPEDISIIGYTNENRTKFLNITLTTVNQCADEIGKTAVETLLRRIKSRGTFLPQHTVIKSELMVRHSTKRA